MALTPWTRSESFHLYAPTWRERIRHAISILFKGKTVYELTFHIAYDQNDRDSMYVDGMECIPLPDDYGGSE